MTKVDIKLATIEQKVDDLKENSIEMLKEIKEQTKKTNGNVAKCMMDIQLLRNDNENCPARLNYENPNQRKEWTVKKVTLYVATLTILINIIFFIIDLKYKIGR